MAAVVFGLGYIHRAEKVRSNPEHAQKDLIAVVVYKAGTDGFVMYTAEVVFGAIQQAEQCSEAL